MPAPLSVVAFALTGIFASAYTAFFAERLTLGKHAALIATAFAGLVLVILRMSPLYVGLYALVSIAVAGLMLVPASRTDALALKALKRVSVATSASVLAVSSAMGWVLAHAA